MPLGSQCGVKPQILWSSQQLTSFIGFKPHPTMGILNSVSAKNCISWDINGQSGIGFVSQVAVQVPDQYLDET